MSEEQHPSKVKKVAVYALKSAVLLTHIESIKGNIERSVKNIRKLNGGDAIEAALSSYFQFDNRGRLIPKDYEQIINYQAYKLSTREFLKEFPEFLQKDGLEELARSQISESDLEDESSKQKYTDRAKELLKKNRGAIVAKAEKSSRLHRIGATAGGLISIFMLTTIIFWAASGYWIALLSLPSVALIFVISLRFAMRAAVHRDKKLYTPKSFFLKYGRIGWIIE